MIGYAINQHGGWRTVEEKGECTAGEMFSITQPALENPRIEEIKGELLQLDLTSIRPLRAGETDRVKEIDAAAQKLRDELATLK